MISETSTIFHSFLFGRRLGLSGKSKAIEVGSEATELLGIKSLLEEMSKRMGRDVNVMIFDTPKNAKFKEPKSIRIPTKKDDF